MANSPFACSPFQMWMRNPAPTLGQHIHEVMREVLGLSEQEIAALHADKVFG